MSDPKFVACDFGAESGRIILGQLRGQRLSLETIHRFPNRQVQILGHYFWDVLSLFRELKVGLHQVAAQGHTRLDGIGIDTWGVDFALIGPDGQLTGNPFSYRDSRTDETMKAAFQMVPQSEIYRRTGIQFLQFNSIYQLLSVVRSNRSELDLARHLLFMPDLFTYFLTGEIRSEYSIASTSQLLNAKTKGWDHELFEQLGLPSEIMAPIIPPGTVVGDLLADICSETGLEPVEVIAPASHDTASAVAAVPAEDGDWAYLSSGTWSLLGIEIPSPLITEESMVNNFTNEGGVNRSIRFLRNVMGMWLLEQSRRTWAREGRETTYSDLLGAAQAARPFKCLINPDAPSFLNPSDMPAVIRSFCRDSGQAQPENPGELVRCILESLALKYRDLVEKLNAMRGTAVQRLHIVGGGSQNALLNQFTANALGVPVVAGPVEATALGNIVVQATARGQLSGIEEGRRVIAESFPVQVYEPQDCRLWENQYQKSKNLLT